MEKKNLDWQNLGFAYHQADWRYKAEYKDGAWSAGELTQDATVVLNECAGVLQYCQAVFEGLKAYTTQSGSIVTFRPDQNAARLQDSARGLEIPPLPTEQFMEAVNQVVRANAHWVPPYGTGASLYLRPYIFAKGPVIGVKPSLEYEFRLFCTPVGPYFSKGAKALRLCVSDRDRAAPHGTGHLKAGLNYAMSLRALMQAHENGYDENLYLDAATRTFVEETGGANLLFVTPEGKVVVPQSPSILPSITRKSLIYVAQAVLGLTVEERPVRLDELDQFAECGLCGTAAVISPVGCVVDHGKEIHFEKTAQGHGPVTGKLYEMLTGMQYGLVEAPEGWIYTIC